MADTTVIAVEGGSLPHGYTLAPGEEWQPLSISVEFDGGGATVAFLPAVAIYAQNGRLLSRSFPADSIGAGDSAEVTFAPFLRETGGGGGGIEFNTDNEGGWFELGAGASIPAGDLAPSGVGIKDTNSGGGVGIWDGDVGGGFTVITGPIGGSFFGGGGINLLSNGGGGLTMASVGSATLDANASIGINTEQELDLRATTDVVIQPDQHVTGAGFLVLDNLPTVNPGGSGRVWNDAGTLKIT